jgi:hypothetical protein
LIDHFEGDIGSIVLKKESSKSDDDNTVTTDSTNCKNTCNEFIETTLASNDVSKNIFCFYLRKGFVLS